MPTMNRILLMVCGLLAAGGCGQAGYGGPLGSAVTQLVSENGISLNGISLNGISLNGISLNGISLNGISLNGISLNGISLNGSTLEGDRGRMTGAAFVGAELIGLLSNGRTLSLRIDSVEPHAEQPDVTLYGVSVARGHRGWQPLCGVDGRGEPIRAIAVAGRWDYREGVEGGGSHLADPDVFTFGCLTGGIAKCVLFGYKPWKDGLGSHHQACTRMLRADYCGDGRPHTRDGVLINLYDGAGIQEDAESWPIEAEWDADGARCVAHQRIGNRSDRKSCKDLRTLERCGDTAHFASGALLMSEFAPR